MKILKSSFFFFFNFISLYFFPFPFKLRSNAHTKKEGVISFEMFDRIFKVNIWDDVFLGQESCLKASQRISCPDSEIASWHGINGRISVLFSSFFLPSYG